MELTAALCCTEVLIALVVLLAAPLLYHAWMVFLSMCWTPLRIKRAFQAQGIPTLPFRFLFGNLPELSAMRDAARSHEMPQVSHDIAPRLLPHCYHWAQKYGVPYVYWFGSQARYDVINIEDAKVILSTKFGHYLKPTERSDTKDLFGNGIVLLEGVKWAHRRRMLNPAFLLERLKAMIPTMEVCTTTMMDKWTSLIETGKAIDVQQSFQELTADIIAHTAFGSSFAKGKHVFELQRDQSLLVEERKNSLFVPGARFLPTAFNRRAWKIDMDIKRGLSQVIKSREESVEFGQADLYGNDLLGLMMAVNKHEQQGNQKKFTMSISDIIDECKTFFFAGQETTATLLTWAFLLLATSSEWQTRTREEVIAVFGTTDMPIAESVNHLKIMGMVVNETLRLYPPAVTLLRQAGTDMQLGKVLVPKATVLMLPIVSWHHDKRYWGNDANEFRPERFSEGVAKASSVPGAFMPFSMGPRVCIGQNLALLEAKVVLAKIMQCYRFRLSPSYKHAPITRVTLQPQFGMPILFEKL